MRDFLLILVAIAAVFASATAGAADLRTTWSAVDSDDTGAPLSAPVTEYRIYLCGEALPIATVAGSVLELLEPDVVSGTGSFCREVSAYSAPFEGARALATLVVVIPGSPATVNVQAIP